MATNAIPTVREPQAPLKTFVNEAFQNFTDSDVKANMQEALRLVEGELGKEYPLILGGERVYAAEKIVSTNPAKPAQKIGVHQEAELAHVEQAVAAGEKAFKTWSRVPVQQRVQLLLDISMLVQQRKNELCAWLTYEVGKNWAEADADVAECIDFLEFYAREALKLDRATTPIQFPGEKNTLRYIPVGVGAVIPPWNFPLAIMAGMTMAAVVSGNTVVLKPSPDAGTIASRFFALLEEAGMPEGVVNLCQGTGDRVGAALVANPKIRFIAFTGSKKVGLIVHETAAKTQPGQHFIKRTILEMGGKDAILVDADADIDAAVEGVVASAFGFSGQKCSACSRAVVDARIYDVFCDRLVERVEKIKVGDPVENFAMGPVVNKIAFDRVLNAIETGKTEGRLLTGGEAFANETGGYYVKPTVFADIAPNARIAQEEIFGPVLAVIKSQNFDEALDIVNGTEYGLTGAIYSMSRERLDRAAKEFHVGNLYLNRKCTGAMVGAHPFGGFNMSGTDSKAGGGDYLLLFTQAKSIAEKQGVIDESDQMSKPNGI
ncbi:L-glutamate gamma-semialdehyde dehydrogenase [Terriglobus sp. TAA 43]|uniref:L-glutamate gamma-semialdehyde dehydrogenase n=1 Tax=Terriglobus sp. TAA 43 TaxID=278961 RepID=UPI00064608D6|nr:L-glutamate gamma-semialdehyde dehydrogenase [Terriglobus sp. TAA 43]